MPHLTKKHLFEARTGGYWMYRIPTLLTTSRGVVLAAVEARRGEGGDWDGADIVMRRSHDNGQSWEAPHCLFSQASFGAGPLHNIVLLNDAQTQTVRMLFCHGYAQVFSTYSVDDGLTFTPPVDITSMLSAFHAHYPWRVIATGPGHGIQLRNGRLLAPIWMSTGAGMEFGPGKLGHRPSVTAVIYSDDHGVTWQCGDVVARTEGECVHPSEAVLVERHDGSVLMNIRTESAAHRRLISISPDGVTGWSTPTYDEALLEPVCCASLIRAAPVSTVHADSNSALGPAPMLFANPDTLERSGGNWGPSCDRKRLTVKMSMDDGATWPLARVLEAGPAAYSDMAVAPNGDILCLYESGARADLDGNLYITLARFDLAWLTESEQVANE